MYTGFNALTSRARQLRHNRRSLSRRYTVFGEVCRGMEVVGKIVAAQRDEFDNPLGPIEMKMTVKE
ncbi:MAG: peptidylprolyl isomerase [Nitrospirota bacterium]